jgi:hypothetical protein
MVSCATAILPAVESNMGAAFATGGAVVTVTLCAPGVGVTSTVAGFLVFVFASGIHCSMRGGSGSQGY